MYSVKNRINDLQELVTITDDNIFLDTVNEIRNRR